MHRRREVNTHGRTYTVSPDEAPLLGDRLWAMVQVQMMDEITNTPVQTTTNISTSNPKLSARISSNGLLCLVGIPSHIFPKLEEVDPLRRNELDFHVTATGYLPYKATALIPQNPGFPNDFSPAVMDLSAPSFPIIVTMHPTATVIHGRVVRSTAAELVPIVGAQVRISGIIRHPVPKNISIDPPPWSDPNILALRPPVYLRRHTDPITIRRQNIGTSGGPIKFLNRFAQAGTRELFVSDSLGLSNGNIIEINPGDRDRSELHIIAGMDLGTTATLPATLTLSYSLAYNHKINTRVRRVVPFPPGPPVAVPDETISGDQCLPVSDITSLATANAVELSGGRESEPELHFIEHYQTTTDGYGFFRLPPVSRVALVNLEVTTGTTTDSQTVNPDYRLSEQKVDFLLP